MTTVRRKLDPAAAPNPADLARVDAVTDGEISFDDIPELDPGFWSRAEVETPAQKAQVTMRVDAETLVFFKGENPKGYTARMASALRVYVKARGGLSDTLTATSIAFEGRGIVPSRPSSFRGTLWWASSTRGNFSGVALSRSQIIFNS